MADKKISQFPALPVGDVDITNDVLPIVDATGPATKKITVTALVNSVFTNTLTASKPVFTDASKNLVSTGTINLASDVSGTLPVANGGTGAATLTANNVLLGNGTSAVQFVAPGTTGNVLTSNGTTWTSAAPSGLPELQVVSGTTQAAVKGKHYVLTNASLTTVTLPATPAAGDTVWVTVANGRLDNVVARNGSNIISLASDLVLNATYAAVQLRYADATRGWILI